MNKKHITREQRIKNAVIAVIEYTGIFIFAVAAWTVAARLVGNDVIFPSLPAIATRLGELMSQKEFWVMTGLSVARILCGVFIAVLLAGLLAVLSWKSKLIRRIIFPINEIVKATPVVSFVFIAYIIFQRKIGWLPVFIASLIVFPVVYRAMLDALDNIEKEQLEVAMVFGCTRGEQLRYIIIPTVLNAFVTSCGTSIGLGWKAGIAAEALAASPNMAGIGSAVAEAKAYIETVDQFAWTFVIVALSFAIGVGFKLVMNGVKRKIL